MFEYCHDFVKIQYYYNYIISFNLNPIEEEDESKIENKKLCVVVNWKEKLTIKY